MENVITVAPLVKAGRLRALAVTTRERSQILPDVPTLAEQGYPDIDVGAWLGVLVSAKTPPAVVARLNEALNAALADPDVKQQLAQQGGIVQGGTPAEFDGFIRSEKVRWEKIIKAAGIKAE